MSSTSMFGPSTDVNERGDIIAGTLIGLVCVVVAVWLKTRVLPRYRRDGEEPLDGNTSAIDDYDEVLWFDPDEEEPQQDRQSVLVAELNSSSTLEGQIDGVQRAVEDSVNSSITLMSLASVGRTAEIDIEADTEATKIPQLIGRDSYSGVGTTGTTVFVGEAVEMTMLGARTAGKGDKGDAVTVRTV